MKEPAPNYKQITIDTIIQIHQHEAAGDILTFLPGKDDIDYVVEIVNDQLELLSITLPLVKKDAEDN